MGAAGRQSPQLLQAAAFHLFKPVPRLAHHGVALSGMDLHAVAHRQVAQPQQLGDRHGVGAGQASAALAAEAPPPAVGVAAGELLQGLLLLGIERFIAMAQLPCQCSSAGLAAPRVRLPMPWASRNR